MIEGIIEIQDILEVEGYLDEIEAVIFDLDDTLYSEKEYVRSGFNAIAKSFPEIKNMGEKLWAAFENGERPIDTVLQKEDCYSQENLEKALYIYRFHKPNIRLYPGVRQMLERLRKSRKLGIITDGRLEGQKAKLEALGLDSLVDKVVITDELGGVEFRKPCDMAFIIMQKQLAVPFGQMIYVGDNLKKDFIAPQRLGMRAVFFCNSDGMYGKRGKT